MQKNVLDYVKDQKGEMYIFGTGKLGLAMKDYLLLHNKELKIDGFVVSDNMKKQDELESLPVYCLSDVQFKEDDSLIVATSKEFFPEIIPNIVNDTVCKNVYVLSFIDEMCSVIVSKLIRKGISLDEEIIDFGLFKVPNLFLLAKDDIGTLVTYACEFVDLVLPYLGDESMIDEGIYEYYGAKLNKGDVVLDCGANVGMFSARAASVGCDVYAFEPAPVPTKWLEKTKSIYNDAINIEPFALADEEGKTQFYLWDECIGAGSMTDKGVKGATIDVNMTTVDEFVKRNNLKRVDFIKADIEGAERLMLKGAKETLRTHAPKLAICTYHCFDDVSALTEVILEANPNYKIVYAWKKLYAWVD